MGGTAMPLLGFLGGSLNRSREPWLAPESVCTGLWEPFCFLQSCLLCTLKVCSAAFPGFDLTLSRRKLHLTLKPPPLLLLWRHGELKRLREFRTHSKYTEFREAGMYLS